MDYIKNIELDKNKSIIVTVVAIIIFLLSLDFASFSGYTFIGMILFGIILFFFSNYILELFKSGKSMIFIVSIIIIFSIISIIIWSGYQVYINKKNINKKWAQYKCRPYVMPFAGLIGPSGTSATENFTECMWSMNKSYFDILISPFTEVLGGITNVLSGIVDDIQNIRKMITFMRSNMEDMAEDILQKIWDSYERISFLFKTILDLFVKLGTVFKDLFDVLLYEYYTFASLINGPIGEVSKFFSKTKSGIEEDGKKFFCFDGETILELELESGAEKYKKIKDIEIGDVLKNDNNIIGKLIFDAKNVDMYCHNKTVVSGEHLVFKNDKWIRIEDLDDVKKIKYNEPYIYCLITKLGIIEINGIIYKDYNETNDEYIVKNIYKYIINFINYEPILNNIIDIEYFKDINNKIDKNIKRIESGFGKNLSNDVSI